MPSLRLLSLAAFAACAASLSTAERDSADPSVQKRQDFFEVGSCHAHGDVLFCIHDGEEWEVTSDMTPADAPDSFTGCHAHSQSEIHCVDADQTYDVSLALESAEDSTNTEEAGHEDHAHASDTTAAEESTSSEEITEVTSCHAHADGLYCMADGEEWQVTTDYDTANPPESYTGCHAHGADELHCTEGDIEASLSRAGAESHSGSSSSSSSSDSSSTAGASTGEAVDCHFHAGVEHCVDENGRTVESGCSAPDHDYDVPLRVGLLFVILVTSAIGVYIPILTQRFTSVSMDGTLIVAMRQFGTGVIISTAIVHLFTHAQLFFNNDCLEGVEYEATTGAILMAGLFLTFLIEYVAHRWVDRKRHMFERPNANAVESNGHKDGPDANISEACSGEQKYSPASLTLNTAVMEAGIIFHSILIGLTLVVAADSGFITLFIVILFHQIFEGFALGSRIAMIPCGLLRKMILGAAFAITTPIGMAIGIGVLSSFNGNDPSTLVAIGTLNAFSAGILLWVGVAEMWFVEWFHGPLAHAGPFKVAVCFLSLVSGLVVMSVLGKWA